MGFFSNCIRAVLHPFWRLTRGSTLGAQAVVINDEGGVLLVRHGYRPGWHFPGGGVEWNESLSEAMARELYEETNVSLTGRAQLHGIFTNFDHFKGDHIGVFIVKDWVQKQKPVPNGEIREIGFFALDDLPKGTVAGVTNRIDEIFKHAPISTTW